MRHSLFTALCFVEEQKYSRVPDHHLKNPTIVYETRDDSSTRDLLLKEILRQMGLVSCKLLCSFFKSRQKTDKF